MDTSSANAAIVSTFESACEKYVKSLQSKGKRETYESKRPYGIYRMSPISLAKAIKNDAELDGMRKCHLR